MAELGNALNGKNKVRQLVPETAEPCKGFL